MPRGERRGVLQVGTVTVPVDAPTGLIEVPSRMLAWIAESGRCAGWQTSAKIRQHLAKTSPFRDRSAELRGPTEGPEGKELSTFEALSSKPVNDSNNVNISAHPRYPNAKIF